MVVLAKAGSIFIEDIIGVDGANDLLLLHEMRLKVRSDSVDFSLILFLFSFQPLWGALRRMAHLRRRLLEDLCLQSFGLFSAL